MTLTPLGFQITVDCHDPQGQVAFWCLALGYRPKPPPEGFDTWRAWYLSVGVPEDELGDGDCQDRVEDPTGQGPSIWFQPVPEPKTVKNRVHWDVTLQEATVADLVAAGATVLREPDDEISWTVLADPEGNEFCVLTRYQPAAEA